MLCATMVVPAIIIVHIHIEQMMHHIQLASLFKTKVPLNHITTYEIPYKNEHLGYKVRKPINLVQM
jgi:hypothetical protein